MVALLSVIKPSLTCSECPWQSSTSTCRGNAASGLPWLPRCSGLWAASSRGQGQPLTVQEPRCRADMLTAKDVSLCFTASLLPSNVLTSLVQQCSRGKMLYCWKLDVACAVPLHQTLQAFAGKRPTLGEQTFVAPNASVIGDVTIGNRASVWYGAVLRGEADCLLGSTAPAVCRVSW